MKSGKASRYFLGALLAFCALNAFGGGWYAISGAPGVPLEWLAGSPFKDYFIPGVFLFVVMGGAMSTASVVVFLAHRKARPIALFTGTLMLAWIAIQVSIIGYVSWMQPAIALAGLVTIVLARSLRAGG